MSVNQEIVQLIQSHKVLESFDPKVAVDWAIDLIESGNDTDNLLMLASFSGNIERDEVSPYISAVLEDLKLVEFDYERALVTQIHYHLLDILKDIEIRNNLEELSQLCINNGYDSSVMTFYLLHHGWQELEDIGVDLYYGGTTLNNIEDVLKTEAENWIDLHIHGKVSKVEHKESVTSVKKEIKLVNAMLSSSEGLLVKFKSFLREKLKQYENNNLFINIEHLRSLF